MIDIKKSIICIFGEFLRDPAFFSKPGNEKLAKSRFFGIQSGMNSKLRELVRSIYPPENAGRCIEGLEALISRYSARLNRPSGGVDSSAEGYMFDESDSVLVTCADQLYGSERAPLRYLLRFMSEELEGHATGVHVLPFLPSSCDDGYSVIDYREVRQGLGDWDDIRAISGRFRLMADLVVNHCSSQSGWFRAFLHDQEPYRRYFLTVEPGTDVQSVVRPHALSLLTPYDTSAGEKQLWTTFNADQVDLNYHEPEVLLEMLDILFFYVENGVQMIRLDSIAYLWKELGTSCLHHPNTHRIVQLIRSLLEQLAPWVVIITDTDAAQEQNLGYLGDKTKEAHVVCNYPLSPLTLDAFIREDTTHLQRWVGSLPGPKAGTGYWNFLASHQGIGLLPTHGILSDAERENLIQTVRRRGGRVSYKSSGAGDIPYELNVNFLSAVADPNLPDEQRVKIFLASQSIMLSLAGIPGIYIHSLIGSTNWPEGIEQTGMNRSINRQKLEYEGLVRELGVPGSMRSLVFEGYKTLLRARAKDSAFRPSATQRVLDTSLQLFVVVRHDEASGSRVLCLHNVSKQAVEAQISGRELSQVNDRSFVDLISADRFYPFWTSAGGFEAGLEPYEVMWLKLT
jgi:glucosylglycerate phosphorylase